MPRARLTRGVRFSAAHRYYRPEWSAEQNLRVFGACANPHGHGHNYLLEVTVEAPIDPLTGFSVDLDALDRILDAHVRQPLDHQHLNHAVPEFAPGGAVPTSENILLHLWPRLAREIAALGADSRLLRLRLHEEQGFHVDYSGDDGPPAA